MEDGASTPHHFRTALLTNLAAVLERCDEQMLPAVYRFIGASWHATPTQLGYITLARALVQALSAPIGGIAGYCLHRGKVVGCGCLLWSTCTALFACSHALPAGVAIWGVNGLGLALVLPNAQSLIADLFASTHRGRAFGMLYLTGALGGMAGALYATNIGSHRVLGLEGWRFAFLSLAGVSAAAGTANLLLTEDPQKDPQRSMQQDELALLDSKEPGITVDGASGGAAPASGIAVPASGSHSAEETAKAKELASAPAAGPPDAADSELQLLRRQLFSSNSSAGSGDDSGYIQEPLPATRQRSPGTPSATNERQGHMPRLQDSNTRKQLLPAARAILADVGRVVRIPTFLIIVLQGIAGSIPWSALVFLTLYFQLLGMSDAQASFLVALFLAGTAFGGLLGGFVGDAAAKRFPMHGRIAVTQFSVGIGIPFACLVFKALPRSGGAGNVVIYAIVLLAFALLKAWPAPACNNPMFAEIVPAKQRNLVYAFDRCFEGAIAACAAPLVGVLAERIFGYSGSGAVTHDRDTDLANAVALGNALLTFLVVPWSFTLVLYTGLHWTYPADRGAALRQWRHTLRERSHDLEEQRVRIDRLSTVSSVLSADSISSIELPLPHQALRRPPEPEFESHPPAALAGVIAGRSRLLVPDSK